MPGNPAAAQRATAEARRAEGAAGHAMQRLNSLRPLLRQSFSSEGPIVPEYLQPMWLWKYQARVRFEYKQTRSQIAVACLIGGNFMTNILEATIDPQKDRYPDVFRNMEMIYNILFTIELLINMYAYWCKSFWRSNWNKFDFVVVSIGLLTMTDLPLPGPLTLLRNMRAFRVFRLFKRIQSLKKILDSLAKAVPGVLNAFIILLLVMSIYSILAVEFWSTFGAGGKILNEFGAEVEYVTPRGQDFGFEYFGNFPKSLYTMFQVMSTDSWAEAVARPLMSTPDSLLNVATGLYFVSFQILCETILINVVVAVLLEKMVDDTELPPEPEDDDDLLDFVKDLPSESKATSAASEPLEEVDAEVSYAYRDEGDLPGAISEDLPDVEGVAGGAIKGAPPRQELQHSAESPQTLPRPEAGRRKARVARLQANVSEMKEEICEVKRQVARLLAALSRKSPEST